MKKINRRLIRVFAPLALLLALGCTPAVGVAPGGAGSKPPPEKSTAGKPPESKPAPAGKTPSSWVDDGYDRRVSTRDVDFARAFEEDPAPRDTAVAALPPVVHSMRYPPIKAPRRPVRVMLRRNIREAAVNSPAMATVYAPGARHTFRGSMIVEADIGRSGTVVATVNRARKELRLPCTLYVGSPSQLLKVGENSYRGALVIVSESAGSFSIINLVGVEDYLRGVVPLEIGNLREPDIEAVKAQAVAARTYTYKRMAANERNLFDVVSTVADQVYGGANAEAETSDKALLSTKDLVMAYEDEMVSAYYHSTCGGKTANIEDVWGGAPQPYLRSVDDGDKRKIYCAGSSSFSWTETWSESQLSGIVRRYSSEGKLEPPFKGGLRKIEVRDRFACGRVRTLVVTSSGGAHIAGGDKVRFLLRRNNPSRQILRSANIKSINIAAGEVTVTGSGYGHGIGMCQVGAIGRARDGQGYEEILKAYYTGIMLRTVAPE